ncbi:MAG: hypothetical protein WBX01_08005 [Nitrososphaeraceae archaeon]
MSHHCDSEVTSNRVGLAWQWQATSHRQVPWKKVRYNHRIGLAKYPKQFKSSGVKTLIDRALQIQGIRPI